MKHAVMHTLETSLYNANNSTLGNKSARDVSPNRIKIQ